MNKLTKEQGVVISGFTGILCCQFSDLHQDVEKRLNRPVFTHEFAEKEVKEQIKEAYREDFMYLVQP